MGFGKKAASKVIAAVSALSIVATLGFSTALSASAVGTASDEVKQNENGIVLVECLYDDSIRLAWSTGFIINNQTIVTSKKILLQDPAEKLRQADSARTFEENKLKVKVKIGDAYITGVDKFPDNKFEFAVIQLNQSVDLEKSNYTALKLDSTAVETTQTIYSIGYATTATSNGRTAENSGVIQTVDDVFINDKEDKVINEGKVNKVESDEFQFSMSNPTEGFIGGPVISESGSVVGMTYHQETDGYKAVTIQKVIDICNNFGIQYTKADSSGAIVTPVESTPVSVTSPDQPATSSETVSDDTPSKEPEKESIGDTEEGSKPEAKSNNNDMVMIIIIIAIAVVVLIIVVVIIIMLATRKSKPEPVAPPPVRPGGYPGSMPPPATQPQLPQQPPMAPPMAPPQPPMAPPMAPPQPPMGGYNPAQGAGETTVLSDGAGETTVLGGGATVGIPSGVLVNTKTSEKIIINKPEFAIGKERSRVDYCISDDNSVSRLHVKIRVRAGRCYVVDMGSKNGTYINGNKLTPNQEVLIQNGDKLKISLIEFEFKG